MSWDRTWGKTATLLKAVLEREAQPVAGQRQQINRRLARRIKAVTVFDYLIVGAGFAGATIAERLAAHAGKRVLICDKRPHIGGNAFDYYNEHGILIHKYGPHIFHTNSAEVFAYLSRFTEWRPYQHRVRASVDGQIVPIPINLDTVNLLYGTRLHVV